MARTLLPLRMGTQISLFALVAADVTREGGHVFDCDRFISLKASADDPFSKRDDFAGMRALEGTEEKTGRGGHVETDPTLFPEGGFQKG